MHSYPDVKIELPPKRAHRLSLKEGNLPGFSSSKTKQALKVLKKLQQNRPKKISRQQLEELCIPIARVTLSNARRDEVFKIAAEIKASPNVRLVSPDFSVLGKKIEGEPQEWNVPYTPDDTVISLNKVNLAWDLVHPSDLSAPAGKFLASREKVAVIDKGFSDHPHITYNLIGFDAADQDQDPRTPESGCFHATHMSGVIGGVGLDNNSYAGVSPGAVIIPVRPAWGSMNDFISYSSEMGFFIDYEEYIENFTCNWVNVIAQLYQLSFSGVELANMSISVNHQVWNIAACIDEWMHWWLREGNYGNGVFAAASAGNNKLLSKMTPIAHVENVFAVGYGDNNTPENLGSWGNGLDLVVNDGRWPCYEPDGSIFLNYNGSGGSSVASAVVAGTAAIMKNLNPSLTADEVKEILRLTTVKIPIHVAMNSQPLTGALIVDSENETTNWGKGYCMKFGWGFLDVHYAVETAWRKRHPAAEIFRVRVQGDLPPQCPDSVTSQSLGSICRKTNGVILVFTTCVRGMGP